MGRIVPAHGPVPHRCVVGRRYRAPMEIRDATADRWDDLADLLGERGDPSRCWCQYYRSEGPYRHDDRVGNRAAMCRQVTTAEIPHGVLAYAGDRPIGWCAVAPRGDYPRLATMR